MEYTVVSDAIGRKGHALETIPNEQGKKVNISGESGGKAPLSVNIRYTHCFTLAEKKHSFVEFVSNLTLLLYDGFK